MFSIPNFLTLAQCFLMHRVSVWNKYSWFIINCLVRELPEILVCKFYVVTALFFFVFKGIICCLHLDKHISITKVYSHSRRRKLICRMFFLIVLMADRVIDMDGHHWAIFVKQGNFFSPLWCCCQMHCILTQTECFRIPNVIGAFSFKVVRSYKEFMDTCEL